MEEPQQNKKEITIIVILSFVTALLVVGFSVLSSYQMHAMHKYSSALYQNPLKISNAALKIQLEIHKMHQNMKLISTLKSKDTLPLLIKKVKKQEKEIYDKLQFIEQNIKGEKGLALAKETKNLFLETKRIRHKIISLSSNEKTNQAIQQMKSQGVQYVKKLESLSSNLHLYALNTADGAQNKSKKLYQKFEKINIFTAVLFLLSFIALIFYTTRKITQYIQRNQSLKELSKNIIDSVDNLIFVKDINSIYITCNKAFAKFVGSTQDEIIGKSDYELFDKETADFFRDNDQKMLKNNETRSNYEWVDDATGEEYYLYTIKSPLVDSKGHIAGLVGNSVNFTEQKKAQKALQESEEQLELAIKGTQTGLWDWNLITNQVYYAPQWKSLLGYEDYELENSYKTWLELTHPDDIAPTEKITLQYKKLFEVSFRMKHKKGHWVWILCRGQTIYGKGDKPIRMIGFHTDISEQQQILQKLRKSEEKFYSLFHNSPDMHLSVSATDATVLACNDTLLNTLGYTKEDVIGHSVFKFYHEESLEAVKDAFNAFIKTGFVKNRALIVKRKDGTKIDITLNANAIRDDEGNILHSIATWRDITELKVAEEALKSSISKMQSIFRSAPIGIGLLKNRIVQEVNDTICHISGYSKEEIIGRDSRFSYPDEETYQFVGKELERQIKEKGNATVETQLCRKDGTIIDVVYSTSPLDPNDISKGFTFTVLDITEEKRKDRFMIVQSRHAAMGEMIGMIAHQWRQPLNIISMNTSNMLVDIELNAFDSQQAKAYAGDILKQTNHLSNTIDDFRNFFKPDRSMSKLNIEKVLDETDRMIGESLSKTNIVLHKEYTTISLIEAYPRELMQVFVNIFKNAKDAFEAQKTDNPQITVRTYEDETYVNVEICDNAGGIDITVLPKIFDPYFTTKDEKTGTGLGLYMSKMIVEDHLNGLLEVSNKNDGACFRIKLLKENSEMQGNRNG